MILDYVSDIANPRQALLHNQKQGYLNHNQR